MFLWILPSTFVPTPILYMRITMYQIAKKIKITLCTLKIYWNEFARCQSQGFKSQVKKLPFQLSLNSFCLHISL